jgi:serine/threonine protein kinase
MASVWVARLQGKHGFEKLVAIKTILPQFSSDPMFQQMFLDEARISSRIEHANVAQILDLGDERGVLYLVMEWVDGDSFSKLLSTVHRKGMSIPHGVSLRILADACGGLHAAHELRDKDGMSFGVVHRDVSPQNILVAAQGTAKIIDFGIAKARDRLAGDTSTGLLKGKVQYMAPEQAFGRSTDRRADVWAVGAVLYHAVSGQAPFNGANQLATLHLLTSGQPPPPLPPDVPAPIHAIIAKALSFDPDKRYESAGELQRALEDSMLEMGISATIADVATFNGTYLAERSKARREAVELALSAAAERARVQDLLQPTADDTKSNRIDVNSARPSLAKLDLPAPSPRQNSEPPTVGTRRPFDVEAAPAEVSPAMATATAAFSPSVVGLPARWPESRKRSLGIAVAALALAVAVGFGLSARRSGREASQTMDASGDSNAIVNPVTRGLQQSSPPSVLSAPSAADVPPAPRDEPSASARASEPVLAASPSSSMTGAGRDPRASDMTKKGRAAAPVAGSTGGVSSPTATKGAAATAKEGQRDYGF